MRLVFSPVYPWWTIAAGATFVLGVIIWSYRPALREQSTGWSRLLFGLRLASWLVLLLALLRPALEFSESESEDSVLFIVGDVSRSMSTRDGPSSKTRRQALLDTLANAQTQLDALREKVQIRQFDFAESVEEVEQFSPETNGPQTAIGFTLEELLREAGTSRMAGVLFMTDGAQRAFASLNTDPRTIALRFGEQKIPIHSLPFGGTGLSESALDLIVEEMIVDPVVFANTTIPVTVRVRAIGAAGKKIRVKLLVENRALLAPGAVGEMQMPASTGDARPVREIDVRTNNEVIPLDLSYTPDTPGEYKIRVEVEPLEREVKTVNNNKQTIITVRKGGIRVAFLHSLPPEQKFVRKIGETEQIQIESRLIYLGKLRERNVIPEDWFEPGRFDAYIIGDIPASVFTKEQLKALADRVSKDGAGFMMLGGIRSFGPGGYAETPLDDILPVQMRLSEKQNDETVATDLHHLRDLTMQPTTRGASHYLMRLDNATDPGAIWRKLPPLQKANKLVAKPGLVETLAESTDGVPLLFSHEVGRARVLAFAADSTWLWHLHGFEDEHLRFWQQVVMWLSRKELDSGQGVWVRVDPRNFGQGQRVPIEFGARDEQGEPIDDVQFQLEVVLPDEQRESPTIRGTGGARSADFSLTEQPGDYWVKVTASRDGQPVGPIAWTRFLVDAGDLELDNPAADYALLEEISRLSGGSVIPPEKLGEFLEQFLEERLPALDLREIRRISLWDNWYFLLVFTTIVCAEWAIRKRRGLV